jgi:small subunit ribosomal protein S9
VSTDEPTPPADDEATDAVSPDDAAAAPADDDATADEATRAAASPEPTAEPPAEEVAAEEPPAEEPVAEEPAPAEEPAAEEAAAEEPAAEEPATEEPATEEPVASAEEATRDGGDQPDEPEQPEPVAEAAEGTGEAADDEFEAPPREKPEIPGADLDPVFVADEEQYLDAEAQAAAEAEAEAQAERLRAEAEDEASMPIADAAIDLAAGARYTATGKRKTAVARVILRPGEGTYTINGKELNAFFPRDTLQRMIRQPLETVGYDARMDVIARMHGGGVASQAGALRHGISRALIVADPNLRSELKRRGFLTRDPRVKERKKAGLKKARKRPQFSKR